jgi:hypothetical protein
MMHAKPPILVPQDRRHVSRGGAQSSRSSPSRLGDVSEVRYEPTAPISSTPNIRCAALQDANSLEHLVTTWFAARRVVELVAQLRELFVNDSPYAVDAAEWAVIGQRMPRCEGEVVSEFVG